MSIRRNTKIVRAKWACVFAGFLLISFCASPTRLEACDELPPGTLFWVRLTDPISSYTAKPGSLVRGFLLQAPECNHIPVLSTKVPVEGKVLSVHRVGLGLRHETASLEIGFFRILPPGLEPIEISARIEVIDYARENVKNGVIHGIRSTDTPQGIISSRLKYLPSLHLYPDPILLAYKVLFPIFPEPEITLPPGTDIQVALVHGAKLPPDLPPVQQIDGLYQTAELRETLLRLPQRTFTKKGKKADVVNMVFVGSEMDLEQAFQAAGWHPSDAVSFRTVAHDFYSFLAKTSYATAPMSSQFLNGHKSTLTLEKAPQSYEKRNHVRIWELDDVPEGTPLWAAAAVHETGGTFSIKHKGFVHHVSEDLDEEQQTVVRDLVVAGCVEAVGSIPRPAMDHVMRNATDELFRTDGSLRVVRLKPCISDSQGDFAGRTQCMKPGSWLFRFLRRQVLTVRSDLWRANCIYAAFDLTRMTVGIAAGRHVSVSRAKHDPEPSATGQAFLETPHR